MIIVEGPDGTGKTTLIRQIQERYPDLPLAPRVVSKDAEAMVDLKEWVDKNLAEGFQYQLYDRHRLISEFIYGPILRKDQQPGFNSYSWVAHSLRRFYRLRPIIIYCLPPLDVVKFNVWQDDTNSVVHDHIEAMYTAYVHRIALDMQYDRSWKSEGDIAIYDYTLHFLDKNPFAGIQYLLDRARERVVDA